MKITYTKKFEVQRKQKTEFLDNAHDFIDKKLADYLSEICNCNEVELSPLGGGIKSVVYEVTTDTNKNFVLKICLNKNYYWNEIVGMDLAKKAGLNSIKRFTDIEDNELGIYGFILENIKSPVLFDQLNSLDLIKQQAVFTQMGKDLKKLHEIKVDGYIEFKFHSYSECTSKDPYYYINYMLNLENKEYILQNKLLTSEYLEKLYKYLKAYTFIEKASVTHGDFSTKNCFYLENNEILLFDFQSAGQDPLFDVATFKYRCLLENHSHLWQNFLDGYEKDINEERINQLLGTICFRKLANAHQKKNIQEYELARSVLSKLF